jgi:hypothetical protein
MEETSDRSVGLIGWAERLLEEGDEDGYTDDSDYQRVAAIAMLAMAVELRNQNLILRTALEHQGLLG